MAKHRILLLVLTCGLPALACAQTASLPVEHAAAKSASLRVADPEGRLLVRRASSRLEVVQLEEAIAEVETIVRGAGGYVADSTRSQTTATLRTRVPSSELDPSLDALATVGRETARSVRSSDVTDQVIDLEARLANQTALRDRLRQLLHRASDVKDVLAIEQQLTRVQTEVDSLTGRLERLRKDVAMSALDVHLGPKRQLGPLGYVVKGVAWAVKRLFVISP